MDGRQPAAGAGACVRDAALAVSCTACVAACPVAALAFGDEGDLDIDAAACTGCGACAAACPTGALALDGAVPVPRAQPGRDGTVLVLCPRRGGSLCLHALGLEALADIWLRGGRRLAMAIGDCNTCPNRMPQGFARALTDLDALLADRGLPPMTRDTASARDLRTHEPLGAGTPDLHRRALFRAALPDPEEPALARLQRAGRPGPATRFAHVARFDADRCTGCDACIRICPASALSDVNAVTGETAYNCVSSSCVGCGLCVDVCDSDAIAIPRMSSAPPALPLVAFRCRGCGVKCRVPAQRGPGDGLCPICTRAGHFRLLHQVLS